ncbi:MAG: HK97 gp10 family phage protein [Firmicutes bacterium]|nr:HK97 gp10 family phage protein [Bacillota bacterium]
MIKVGITFSGQEVKTLIEGLSKNVASKIIRKSVRDGMKVYQDEAKGTATTMVGGTMGMLLADSMQIRARKKKKKGFYAMNVLLKSGVKEFFYTAKKGKQKTTYIPAAIEYGHFGAAPIPFMRKAFLQSKEAIIDTVQSSLKDEIELAVK